MFTNTPRPDKTPVHLRPFCFIYQRGEDWPADHLRRVRDALEHYNKENGTEYEVAIGITGSSAFESDGTWFHLNFKAKQAMDSKYKPFFAEIQADTSPMLQTLTVTACLINDGFGDCDFCQNMVIHPHRGCGLKQHYPHAPICPLPEESEILSKRTYNFCGPCPPPEVEWSDEHLRHVNLALEYYNKKNGTEYEASVRDFSVSDSFELDGTWFHMSFWAKQLTEDKYCKPFSAEIRTDASTETVTACVIMEGGQDSHCHFCSNGPRHPLAGIFVKQSVFWPESLLNSPCSGRNTEYPSNPVSLTFRGMFASQKKVYQCEEYLQK